MSFTVTHRHVVVAGGGRSGLAAADLLLSRGARVTLSDLREPAGAAGLRRRGATVDVGPHRPDLFAGADLVVLSPGVPPDQNAVQAARRAGVPVIGEVELAFRWLSGRVIAITGTKGKSTTTTLTARMLQEAGLDATAGGNLGTALSTQVASSHPGALHVVEVSSFQLETTDTFHPWIAVLLNLSPDHLDRHPSFEAYAMAKARIFAKQTADDWAVVNADDAPSMALAESAPARRFDFALDADIADGVTVRGGDIVRRDGGRTAPLAAGVRRAAARPAPAGRTCSRPPPLAASRACRRRRCGARSRGSPACRTRSSASPKSTASRSSTIPRRPTSHRRVAPSRVSRAAWSRSWADASRAATSPILRDVVRAHAAGLVAIGEAAPLIEDALGGTVPVKRAASMADAVAMAAAMAAPGGVVLLAPACSSFDMFTDYADRGERFREAVKALERVSRSV